MLQNLLLEKDKTYDLHKIINKLNFQCLLKQTILEVVLEFTKLK